MKIVLVNPPGWQKGSTNLGLCYLAGALISQKNNVLIYDLNSTEESFDNVALKVKDYAPDIIGFSVKTATAKNCFLLSKVIKTYYAKAIHVAGGPHITLFFKETLLENDHIDYCFIGESDLSLPEFVNKQKMGENIDNIAGLAYRKQNRVVATPRQNIVCLDALPFPSFDVIENFSFENFRYPLLSSRGCPYKCTYCSVGLICGKKWRARTPENILKELQKVKQQYNLTSFEVLDDNFSLDLDRAKQFCKLLIKNKLQMSWYCHNGLRADR